MQTPTALLTHHTPPSPAQPSPTAAHPPAFRKASRSAGSPPSCLSPSAAPGTCSGSQLTLLSQPWPPLSQLPAFCCFHGSDAASLTPCKQTWVWLTPCLSPQPPLASPTAPWPTASKLSDPMTDTGERGVAMVGASSTSESDETLSAEPELAAEGAQVGVAEEMHPDPAQEVTV